MGGEKFQKPIDMLQDMGSPPRGRGKVLEFALVFRWCRITPAWAGKSCFAPASQCALRDHPRVGGEKTSRKKPKPAKPGSPPRGRGKGNRHAGSFSDVGITPAWAGKSGAGVPGLATLQDHPRVGGEKIHSFPPVRCRWGSPPRGRGKVSPRHLAVPPGGITPAWAGKSSGVCRPRMPSRGSPPRGRGKDLSCRHAASTARITPAWAGKSFENLHRGRHPGDHPRVGGEKTKKIP